MLEVEFTAGLLFLKLGGSLITEKSRPFTARPQVIARLAEEIKLACQQNPHLRLIIGHGSGSFGHTVAQKYATRQGVRNAQEWWGFVEVWRSAASLHHLVMQAFHHAGLLTISFPPSACVIAQEGRIITWDVQPIEAALSNTLIPVVYGDVVFDRAWGGTVLSTEDLFYYLADQLRPQRILFAGREAGVWADYPANTRLLPEITPEDVSLWKNGIGASAAVDVTGGMLSKVEMCVQLVQQNPTMSVRIFSAEESGALLQALSGTSLGTCIHR